MFDRWDHTLQDDNDTESNLVVASLCVGFAFAAGTIVAVDRIQAMSSASVVRVVLPHIDAGEAAPILSPAPAISPPTILRL